MDKDLKINFSIPVHLFNYRESENSLYSYAKLKIFYVGQTGDGRLFTKKFSDQLIESLPYVPVVGYYDEESEDFIGHKSEVQYIYGIVPEDTGIEYIKEGGKEYAVCDVILYTGRNDKTGEIAQKIVGKQHSLELNPNNTKYKVNRDSQNKIQTIEFTEGTLLGLSILGDNEKPAFGGSGFFTQNEQFAALFESFRVELERFTKEKRGEQMEVDKKVINDSEERQETQEEFSVGLDEQLDIKATSDNIFIDEEPTFTTISFHSEPKSDQVDTEVSEDAEEFDPVVEVTTAERFLETFMVQTADELFQKVWYDLVNLIGEDIIEIQWSPLENVLVYYDFNLGGYYRTQYTLIDDSYFFTESVPVKPRYLTEEEIEILFGEDVIITSKTKTEKGTEEFEETPQVEEVEVEESAEGKQEEATQEEKEDINATSLTNSERAELEAFRAERKENLISSFAEDLSEDFLNNLRSRINEYSFEEIEILLSKEYTRISRKDRKITKQSAFVYIGNTTSDKTEVQKLIDQYKTKK